MQPPAPARRARGTGLLQGFFEPCVLLLLSESRGPTHGYRLLERLTRWGVGTAADRGNLYRLLHRLEREGLVSSTWQAGHGGPERRGYMLTAAGHVALAHWEDVLERDRD